MLARRSAVLLSLLLLSAMARPACLAAGPEERLAAAIEARLADPLYRNVDVGIRLATLRAIAQVF